MGHSMGPCYSVLECSFVQQERIDSEGPTTPHLSALTEGTRD